MKSKFLNTSIALSLLASSSLAFSDMSTITITKGPYVVKVAPPKAGTTPNNLNISSAAEFMPVIYGKPTSIPFFNAQNPGFVLEYSNSEESPSKICTFNLNVGPSVNVIGPCTANVVSASKGYSSAVLQVQVPGGIESEITLTDFAGDFGVTKAWLTYDDGFPSSKNTLDLDQYQQNGRVQSYKVALPGKPANVVLHIQANSAAPVGNPTCTLPISISNTESKSYSFDIHNFNTTNCLISKKLTKVSDANIKFNIQNAGSDQPWAVYQKNSDGQEVAMPSICQSTGGNNYSCYVKAELNSQISVKMAMTYGSPCTYTGDINTLSGATINLTQPSYAGACVPHLS